MSNSRISINISYNFLNVAITSFFSTIVSIIIIRTLGPEKVGIYNYVIWLAGILTLFLSLGLHQTITKYISEYAGKSQEEIGILIFRKIIKFQISIALCFLLLFIIFFSTFTDFLHKNEFTGTLYIFIALSGLLPATIFNILSSVISGLLKNKIFFIQSIIVSPLTFGVTIIILLTNKSVPLLLLVPVFGNIVSIVIFILFLKKWIFKKIQHQKIPIKKLVNYSVGVYIIIILDTIISQRSEIFFLGKYSAVTEVAFYSIGYNLASVITTTLIAGAIFTVLMPAFSEKHGKKDTEGLKKIYYQGTKLLSFVLVPLCFGGIIIAKPFITLIYGNSYQPVIQVFQILIVSAVLGTIGGVASSNIYGTGKQWFIVKTGIIIAIIKILLDLWLIPWRGSIGATIVNSFTQILTATISTLYLIKFLKYPFPIRSIFKILIASIGMYGILYSVGLFMNNKIIYIIVALFLGFFCYTFLVLCLKILEKTDIAIIDSVSENFPIRFRKYSKKISELLKKYARD